MSRVIAADNLRRAGVVLALWTVYGAIETGHSYFQLNVWQKPVRFWEICWAEMSFAYLCAACTPWVLWLGRNMRVSGPHRVRNLLVLTAGCLIFMSVVRLSWDLLGGAPNPFYKGGATVWKAIVAISGAYESTFS